MSRIPTTESLARSIQRSNKEPLDRLKEAVHVAAELATTGDALMDHFVEEARLAGHSWTELGVVLGMTKQAAQQRFRTRWFERFTRNRLSKSNCMTDRAQQAVEHAEDEARRLNHNYIGTEHLLLALLRDHNSVAGKALKSLNVSLNQIRQMLRDEVGLGTRTVGRLIPFTPRAKRALDLAVRESRQLGHGYLGTEHILLALSALDEGLAAQFLSASGVRYDHIRTMVISLLTNQAS